MSKVQHMKDLDDNLEPLHTNELKDLERLEEGETFGEKDKKEAFNKNSIYQPLNEDLLSNKFNAEGLELL